MQATGTDVPLTLEQSELDFQCCYVDTAYRKSFTVRNAGAVATKATVSMPQCAQGMLDVHPKFGCVQAAGKLTFTLSLHASKQALAECHKYIVNGKDSVLEIPLKVTSPCQSTPASCTALVQLTTSELTFEPERIDLGACKVGETAVVPLNVHNPSALPASFAFLDVPKSVTIGPHSAFGAIMPGATAQLQLRFTAGLAGEHRFSLTCKTLALRTFALPCTATAEQLPLRFSHNRIEMAATALGSSCTASTVLVNSSSTEQVFEFGLLPGQALTVSPRCGTVPAHSSVRIQIDYDAAPSAEQLQAAEASATSTQGGTAEAHSTSAAGSASAAPSGAVTGAVSPAAWAVGSDLAAPWPQSRTWHVPCFVQSSAHGVQESCNSIQLHVDTCAAHPRIALLGLAFDWSKSVYTHTFGPVSVGAKAALLTKVQNLTDEALPLHLDALNPVGPFEQVSAARVIPAGATQTVKLQYAPSGGGDHLETATLRVPGHAVRLQLSGQGVTPRLELQPSDAPTQLDLGDVRAGDEVSQTFTLRSPCPFVLRCQCVLAGKARSNANGQPPFLVSPGSATIQPGATLPVTVTFQPDCQVCVLAGRLHRIAGNAAHSACGHGCLWSKQSSLHLRCAVKHFERNFVVRASEICCACRVLTSQTCWPSRYRISLKMSPCSCTAAAGQTGSTSRGHSTVCRQMTRSEEAFMMSPMQQKMQCTRCGPRLLTLYIWGKPRLIHLRCVFVFLSASMQASMLWQCSSTRTKLGCAGHLTCTELNRSHFFHREGCCLHHTTVCRSVASSPPWVAPLQS